MGELTESLINSGSFGTNYPLRVALGVSWLDRVHKGWDEEVDLSTLDLASSCNCVLGQIVTNQAERYEDDEELGEKALDIKDMAFDALCDGDPTWLEGINGLPSMILSEQEARELGFHTLTFKTEEWVALTAEWRRVIEARRGT